MGHRPKKLLDQGRDPASRDTADAIPTAPVSAGADNVTALKTRQTTKHGRRQRFRDRFAPGTL